MLVLDAATLATLGRCRPPQALRSPDGRFVFAAAADGWVLRLDLQQFGALQRTRRAWPRTEPGRPQREGRKASEKQASSLSPWARKAGIADSTMRAEPQT